MVSVQLHDNLVFHDKDPYAEPLSVDKTGRVLNSPSSLVRQYVSMRPHTRPCISWYSKVRGSSQAAIIKITSVGLARC